MGRSIRTPLKSRKRRVKRKLSYNTSRNPRPVKVTKLSEEEMKERWG